MQLLLNSNMVKGKQFTCTVIAKIK